MGTYRLLRSLKWDGHCTRRACRRYMQCRCWLGALLHTLLDASNRVCRSLWHGGIELPEVRVFQSKPPGCLRSQETAERHSTWSLFDLPMHKGLDNSSRVSCREQKSSEVEA